MSMDMWFSNKGLIFQVNDTLFHLENQFYDQIITQVFVEDVNI